jgi:hypothetical protein
VFHCFFFLFSGAFQGYAKVLCGIGRECTDVEWLKGDGSGTWGEVFKVEWKSVQPVPFNKTQHIVNTKNSNKLIKIGYDGQEMGAVEGEQLRALFHPNAVKLEKMDTSTPPPPITSSPVDAAAAAAAAVAARRSPASVDGQPIAPARYAFPRSNLS